MSVITRNALSLLSSQVAILVIAAGMLIIGPRFLGEVDFGRLSFALTYVGFFTLVGQLGTKTYLVKMTARNPSQVGLYVFNALAMKLALAVALSVVALGLGVVLGYEAQDVLLIAAACAGMGLFLLNDSLLAGLHGLEKMGRPAAWGVAQQFVAAALVLLVVVTDRGVVAYAMALVPAGAIPLIANSHELRDQLAGGARLDLRVWRAIALGGLPYLVSGAIVFVYGSVDMLMLRPLADDATVGWYALAYRWVGLPVLIAGTALAALFPSLAVHGEDLTDRFFRTANLALKFVALVGLPISAGIALVADDFIDLLYGTDFRESVILIIILAAGIPIIVVDMVLAMILVASDRQKQWILVGCIAAVMNPLLNLWAIPLTVERYGNGAIGAATVTLVTELVLMCGFIYLRPHGVLDRDAAQFMLRCALASAVLVVVVLVLGDAWLPLRIIVGVAVYGLASLVLGTVSRNQIARWRTQLEPGLRSRSSSSSE